MAKIGFSKLSLKRNDSIKEIEWNGQKIEVKQFLPTGDKLDLISRVVNLSTDDNAFYNPCKVEIFEIIETIIAYTNINVTDKQFEDVLKLYDLFVSSGFKDAIYKAIPKEEIDYINKSIFATITEIYRYRDSALGIMQSVAEDFKNTDLDARKIINTLQENPEGMELLKDVVTKVG